MYPDFWSSFSVTHCGWLYGCIEFDYHLLPPRQSPQEATGRPHPDHNVPSCLLRSHEWMTGFVKGKKVFASETITCTVRFFFPSVSIWHYQRPGKRGTNSLNEKVCWNKSPINSVVSLQRHNIEPVAVPSTSPVDIGKYPWSFIGSNFSVWIVVFVGLRKKGETQTQLSNW